MKRLVLAGFLAGLIFVPRASYAQISIGGQGSWGNQRDWALGGRLTWDLSPRGTPVAFIGAFDWFFQQHVPVAIDAEYWEINVNAVYIQTIYRPEAVSYVGGGLNVARIKEERTTGTVILDDTRYGANLVGGTRYKLGRIAPFFELRYIIEGGEQFVLTAGLDLMLGDY